MATKPVIVGVDGSEESLRAVEWAALEARRHGSSLRISAEAGRHLTAALEQ
jgi:nucleotide-binding universal stress UspA family protein